LAAGQEAEGTEREKREVLPFFFHKGKG